MSRSRRLVVELLNPGPLTIVELLNDRCPGLEWHSGRVSMLLSDFPDCDHLAAASGTADWIAFGQSGRVRDGVQVLRTRLERMRAAAPAIADAAVRAATLEAYDVFAN